MKDQHDTKTLEIPAFPLPRRPGRPKTGNALTPAQKQAAYRARKAAALAGEGGPGADVRTYSRECVEGLEQRISLLESQLRDMTSQRDKALHYEGVNVLQCERLRLENAAQYDKISQLEMQVDRLNQKPKRVKPSNPFKALPSYGSLCLLVAQYNDADSGPSTIPYAGGASTASSSEIEDAWASLFAAWTKAHKNSNVTKNAVTR